MESPWIHRRGVYTTLSLCSAIAIASSAVAIKEALRDCAPIMLTGVRFSLAGALLCAVVYPMRLPWPRGRDLRRVLLLGLLNNAGYVGFTGLAVAYLSAGMSSTMGTASTVLLAVSAALFLRETITQRMVAGFMLAIFGVGLVLHSRLGTDNQPIGVLLSVIGHTINVVGCILFKRWNHRSHVVVSYALQLLVGGVVLTAVALAVEGVHSVHWTLRLAACLVYLIVVVSYGGLLTWFYLLEHGTAARAGAFRFMVPVFGLLQGAWVLGERLSWYDLIGAGGVAAGVYFTQQTPPVEEPQV